MANAEYRVGDKVTVTGVVTHVGSNGGNPEYTIAVNNPDTDRPISVPNAVDPAAYTDAKVKEVKPVEEKKETPVAAKKPATVVAK